jgi:hypothetical protein
LADEVLFRELLAVLQAIERDLAELRKALREVMPVVPPSPDTPFPYDAQAVINADRKGFRHWRGI